MVVAVFLGFAEVISYNPQTHIRANSRYRQDFPYIGMLVDITQVSNAAGSKFAPISDTATTETNNWRVVNSSTSFPVSVPGTPLSYMLNQWESRSTAGKAVYSYVTDSVAIKHSLGNSFDQKKLSNFDYDDFGNVTSSSASTYASSTGPVFARELTSNTYSYNDAKWLQGQLSSTSKTYSRVGASSINRKSDFAYDAVSGNLIQEITDPDSSTFRITNDFKLDAYGNRIQTKLTGINMNARKSSQKYDKLGRFVTENINALNHTTRKVTSWDVFGNPLALENTDGVRTTASADFMGRIFASYTQTGVWSKAIMEFGPFNPSSQNTHHCPQAAIYRTSSTGGGVAAKIQCFDQMERVIRTATSTLDGKYAYTDQYFDSSGRLARISEPYFSSDTMFWSTTGYDWLGRITSLDSAAGDDLSVRYNSNVSTSCTSETNRVVKTTNGLGQSKVEVRNALGETTEVYDDNCGRLSYQYDVVGNLTRVTGADDQIVTMQYDIAGRKLAMDDPDKGSWQYIYNALGELKRQLDSKNQAVDFTYDTLGRVTIRRELSSVPDLAAVSGYNVVNKETSSYIVNGSGNGQSSWVSYRSGEAGTVLQAKTFTYDLYGRLVKVETGLEDELDAFEERTTYDQHSRVFQQFDASGDNHGLRYVYSNGYLSQLKEAREGTAGTIYQDILAMDARGNVTNMQLGNGVDVYASYEQTSGKLTRLSAYDDQGMEIQDVDYLFDVLGNLKKRHDVSAGTDKKEAFSYDGLNRLTRVLLSAPVLSLTNAPTLSLNYDASGNIKCKSDVGGINGADGCFNTLASNYNYGANAGPHAVTAAGGVSYAYDVNGNQTSSSAGRTITYTVFDKPTSINKGINRTDFSYGVGNSRYQRKDYEGSILQKQTLYLGKVERITENGSTKFNRYLGGVAIASYFPVSGERHVSYLLKDHLGSIHKVLDASGLITATMHFGPFGERQGTDWQTPLTSFLYSPLNNITTHGFTGHEQVDSVGITHMNGRIYDPKLGRFLQADPIVQAPKNSQSLNRYSYVLNSPLSYTDPSGYFSPGKFLKKWGPLIVAIVVSYFTYGAASAWAWGLMPSTAAGVATSGAYVGSAVIGGAAAGFVGGAIISRSLTGAVKGAFAGALTGGIAGYFGNTYSASRIAADSVAGGISAEIYGQKFKDGLLFAALVSSATYVTVRLRAYQVAQSQKYPGQIGESGGYRGITGKLGGERTFESMWLESGAAKEFADGKPQAWIFKNKYLPFKKTMSPLGGFQGAEGMLFGNGYRSGGFLDYIIEGYAGVHDTLNQSFFLHSEWHKQVDY